MRPFLDSGVVRLTHAVKGITTSFGEHFRLLIRPRASNPEMNSLAEAKLTPYGVVSHAEIAMSAITAIPAMMTRRFHLTALLRSRPQCLQTIAAS